MNIKSRPRRWRSIKVADDTYRRANRIAKREQRTLGAVLDLAVSHYDREGRRYLAELRKEPIR